MHRLREVLAARRIVSAPPDATVRVVVVIMTKGRVGAIPIVDGGQLVGVFSERDLMTRVVVPQLDMDETRVSEVMTVEVVTATLEDTVDDCVGKMRQASCRHLPVMADGRLIGMVSMRDLLRDEIREQDDEIRSLRAYIHQTPI